MTASIGSARRVGFAIAMALATLVTAMSGGPATAQQSNAPSTFPWKAGDPPPPVAGLRLGIGQPEIKSILGPPLIVLAAGDTPEAGVFLHYGPKGIVLGVAPSRGLLLIMLTSRAAGNLGGVAVGDTVQSVVERWGPPRAEGCYDAGTWTVMLAQDASHVHVASIGLAWDDAKCAHRGP